MMPPLGRDTENMFEFDEVKADPVMNSDSSVVDVVSVVAVVVVLVVVVDASSTLESSETSSKRDVAELVLVWLLTSWWNMAGMAGSLDCSCVTLPRWIAANSGDCSARARWDAGSGAVKFSKKISVVSNKLAVVNCRVAGVVVVVVVAGVVVDDDETRSNNDC